MLSAKKEDNRSHVKAAFVLFYHPIISPSPKMQSVMNFDAGYASCGWLFLPLLRFGMQQPCQTGDTLLLRSQLGFWK